jgi:hypothetical protein
MEAIGAIASLIAIYNNWSNMENSFTDLNAISESLSKR